MLTNPGQVALVAMDTQTVAFRKKRGRSYPKSWKHNHYSQCSLKYAHKREKPFDIDTLTIYSRQHAHLLPLH